MMICNVDLPSSCILIFLCLTCTCVCLCLFVCHLRSDVHPVLHWESYWHPWPSLPAEWIHICSPLHGSVLSGKVWDSVFPPLPSISMFLWLTGSIWLTLFLVGWLALWVQAAEGVSFFVPSVPSHAESKSSCLGLWPSRKLDSSRQ